MPTPEAIALIRAGREVGPIPKYGSVEFAALDEKDPRVAASFAMAAENWRLYCSEDFVRDDVARQVDQLRRHYLADLFEAYQVGLSGHAEVSKEISAAGNWSGAASSLADVQRAQQHRQAMLQPRVGDFPGRSPAPESGGPDEPPADQPGNVHVNSSHRDVAGGEG